MKPNRATKPGVLPMAEAPATPEEHIHNAVMHLSRTGEATVANVAARTGLTHAHTIGILSKLRQMGHVLRDGPQYRLGTPIPEKGLTAKPKTPKGNGTPKPVRLFQPGEVEQAIRAAGFQHAGEARQALLHLQQHGKAGLIQQAKEARETMETEFQRDGHHRSPRSRVAADTMRQAGQALAAGHLHPDVQLTLTGMGEKEKRRE